LITDQDSIFAAYDDIIADLTDNTALEKEAQSLQSECDVVLELMQQAVAENAQTALDQADYQRRYDDLVFRYENVKKHLSEIDAEITSRKAKRTNIESFMQTLLAQECLLTEFDEGLWNATIDCLIVHTTTKLTFSFKDGTEIPWEKE
jgi:DNA mismatch repair ATPase MutS